jgi:uncharacterized membrane protein YjfL (UPF0719 family)
MALKTPHFLQEKFEFIGNLSMLIGSLCVVISPTVYGVLSFLYSDSKGKQVGEIITGLGFGSLAVGLLISLAVSINKKVAKRRERS